MADNIPIKMIKLQSSDGEVFEVPETILASQSDLVKDKMAEGIQEVPISVPHATAEVLAKVITYCKKHAVAEGIGTKPASKEELDHWDEVDFFVAVDEAMVLDIRKAAKYLKINNLWMLTSLKFKDMLKEKNNAKAYESNCLKK